MGSSRPSAREAPCRGKLQAIVALVLFSGGVIFGALLLVNYFRESAAISAYRAAYTCPAAEALNSQTCRFTAMPRCCPHM